MTFISLHFLAFLIITYIIYIVLPLKIRYMALLGGSLYFYYQAGAEKLPFLIAAAAITYLSGILIDRVYRKDKQNKEKARIPFWIGIAALLIMLIYAKIGNQVMEALSGILQGNGITPKTIIPLGVSYYTFAAIGYLADVYWKSVKLFGFSLCLFNHGKRSDY